MHGPNSQLIGKHESAEDIGYHDLDHDRESQDADDKSDSDSPKEEPENVRQSLAVVVVDVLIQAVVPLLELGLP